MNHEKILVTKSSMPPFEEYLQEIKTLWDTKWLTNMGEKHRQLSKDLKQYLGVDHISLMVNGHMSIEMGIQVWGFPAGSEIITTPFTFTSTTHAIVRNNLKPVFCDIEPDNYTIDANKIEDLITDKTVAIMPVHVYGNICNIEAIEDIATQHKLVVLYDAAHAFGETYKGRGIGNFGDMSFFSFHATKVFHTIEGGAICYRDKRFSESIDEVKNFGMRGPEDVSIVGGNAKMNEFAASMGLCNLRHIDEAITKRKRIVQRYRSNLSGIEGVVLNIKQSDVLPNYAYFPVLFKPEVFGVDRNTVQSLLAEHNIYSRKYFYPLTSTYKCYKRKYNQDETPIAKTISEQVLCLPLYDELSLDDTDRICSLIKSLHSV